VDIPQLSLALTKAELDTLTVPLDPRYKILVKGVAVGRIVSCTMNEMAMFVEFPALSLTVKVLKTGDNGCLRSLHVKFRETGITESMLQLSVALIRTAEFGITADPKLFR